ncbi:MAG: DUF2341 domain-containing protein [Candidatus Moraniibacteriota bacterium]
MKNFFRKNKINGVGGKFLSKIQIFFNFLLFFCKHPKQTFQALRSELSSEAPELSSEKLFKKLKRLVRWCFATLPRRVVSSILIALFILTPFYGILFAPKAQAGWWNDQWLYRKSIAVANSSGSTLTDFQIKILDNKDLSSDITAGKIQATLNDLRFTDINGDLLSYWIEDATSTSVDVWVKMKTIPTSGSSVYMYYGNSGASAVSNGNSVFEFFDDFNSDLSKWVIPSTCGSTLVSGYLNIPAGLGCDSTPMYANNLNLSDSPGYVFELKGKYSSGDLDRLQIYQRQRNDNGYLARFWTSGISATYYQEYTSGWSSLPNIGANNMASDNWYDIKIIVSGNNNGYYINNSLVGTNTSSASLTSFSNLTVGLGEYLTNTQYDNVKVRKYASTDPVTSAPASEEKGPGTVGYWKLDEGTGTVGNDSASKGNNVSLQGATWKNESDCVAGKCLEFSGANQSAPVDQVDTPTNLFAKGEQGVNYDPSDLSTMYQDSAGTTAVTGLEQPVGLVLDKSKGLVLGSELIVSNSFNTDTDWIKGPGWSIAGGLATKTVGVASSLNSTSTTYTVGKWYKLVYTTTISAGGLQAVIYGGTTLALSGKSASGTYTEYFTPLSGNTTLAFYGNSSFEGTIDNVSVKEVPGNHAYQATSTKRPVLSSRVNLLTQTEDFSNAVVWVPSRRFVETNVVRAPDGALTADKITQNVVDINSGVVSQSANVPSATIEYSIYAKKSEYNFLALGVTGLTWFNLSSGTVGVTQNGVTASISNAGDGWYKCKITQTLTANSYYFNNYIAITDGSTLTNNQTGGIYLWGADLRASNSGENLPSYQRVGAATYGTSATAGMPDYDTVGFPKYLKFDGSDDALQTNSIDFSSTDKMTVWAGVRKLSDYNGTTIYAELGNASVNNGTFLIGDVFNATGHLFVAASKGTNEFGAYSYPLGYTPAPITKALMGSGDITSDIVRLRVNGTQVGETLTDQGAGNYGNYPLYIGARAGTSFYFTGNLYSMIVRGV